MKNCTTCEKSFKGARKSAENENGEFFLICNGCSQVYFVSHDENGLTVIEKTKNGVEAYDQMKEAKVLFAKAGIGIYGFKDDIHAERKSSLELEEKEEPTSVPTEEEKEEDDLSPEERAHVLKTQEMVTAMLGVTPDIKELEETFKKVKNDPMGTLLEVIDKINEAMPNCEECECQDGCEGCESDNCDENDCCDSDAINTIDNFLGDFLDKMFGQNTETPKEATRMSEAKYIMEVMSEGQLHGIKLKSKEDLEECIECMDRDNIEIISVVELTPVELEKKTITTIK